ncbi:MULTISPECIES: septum formation family protein [unclassified Microbacterium]|uniref:septum formation family protein n=1 Tax=unclassified Microbacterium TaxID=2609290 RepID=UPI00301ADB9E
MKKTRIGGALLLTGTALTLALGLSGCSALASILSGGDAERDETTGQVKEGADIDIFALKVGDCMPTSESAGEISEASVVPCSEPHGEEVYFEFSLPDGEFPDDAEIDAQVEAQCLPAFDTFVGMAWEDSTLSAYPITPTKDTWDTMNDRVVQCVILDPDNDALVGTLKGAAR